jgi:outer membrane protein TolC
MMTRVLVFVTFVLCWPALTWPQPAPVHLTLPEAIARGLASSNRLAELLAREEAARAVEDQRQAAHQPQLSLIGSYTRTNHVEEFGVPNTSGGLRILYPDIPDNVRSRVDLQWPIYTGGRLNALIKAAGAEAEATAQDRDAARADLKLEITRA